MPPNRTDPEVGRGQLDDRLAGGRLAAARLADQPQRLAPPDVERHAGHGVHGLATRGELDDQVLDPEEGVGVGAQVGGSGSGHQVTPTGVAGGGVGPGGADRVPAPVLVAGLRLDERRGLGPAAVLRVRAAGGEPAARRRRHQARRPARDGPQRHAPGLVEPGDRPQQRLGVGHADVGEQPGRRRLLDDLPGVHDGHLVRPPGHDAEVVGDQDHRHVALALLAGQQVEDLGLDGHVEGGGGLVGEQELGPAGQRHGDHDPLAHAARQLVGVLVQAPGRLGDADRGEQGDRVPPGGPAVEVEVVAEALGDLGADPLDRVEGGHGVLEHHGHLGAPQVAPAGAVEGRDVAAAEADGALPDHVPLGQQAHDRPAEHRLARTGLADDAEGPAPVEGERHAVDGPDEPGGGAEARAEVGDLQQPLGGPGGAAAAPPGLTCSSSVIGAPFGMRAMTDRPFGPSNALCHGSLAPLAHSPASRTSNRARITSPR